MDVSAPDAAGGRDLLRPPCPRHRGSDAHVRKAWEARVEAQMRGFWHDGELTRRRLVNGERYWAGHARRVGGACPGPAGRTSQMAGGRWPTRRLPGRPRRSLRPAGEA